MLFGETLGNPGLEVLDIPRVADLAHERGLPLLVDSTFTTPWLMRPFDLGADIKKYLPIDIHSIYFVSLISLEPVDHDVH